MTCQKPVQLEECVKSLSQEGFPFILIGNGSNLVVSDDGVDCVVIRYVSDTPLIQIKRQDIVVSGSTSLDALALYAAENGLKGLNCTTGIPGTVGGAIAGNAGAFGKQIGDCLKSASLISKNGVKKEASPDEFGFSYRHSILKKTKDIVLEACLSLYAGDKDALLKERQEILDLRREKHPDINTHPCAGSFFRNIEPTSKADKRQAAGWFLDQAGAKQMRCGGAVVFEKHANIIINTGTATSQDVLTLSKEMAQAVKAKFNLDLIREVQFVGKFDAVS